MSKYTYNSTLQGKHKAFNQNMFNRYDIPARNIVKAALGEFVTDNPDQYKQDLIITDETYKYKYIELQVCATWIGDKFPYDHVFIYERKCHYGNDTLFMTLNKEMTRGYIFDAESFKNVKPRRFKKYCREFIYDIPWYRIMSIYTDTLTPEIIKMY